MQQHQSSNVNVQARARELDEIARSINSLADLFKDLSSLVIEQGTILDSIEYNIERTAEAMEGAVHELNVAKGCVLVHSLRFGLTISRKCSLWYGSDFVGTRRYQRRAGRRQCICLLLVLIVAAIIVLIFKPKRHSSSSPPATETPSLASELDVLQSEEVRVRVIFRREW